MVTFMKILLLVLPVSLTATTPSTLSCSNYQIQSFGPKHSRYQIQFYSSDDKPYLRPTLPANASVGPSWQLKNAHTTPGANFILKTCTSASLQISPQPIDFPDCADGGCLRYYQDYVLVINPYTGHCLTRTNATGTPSDLTFATCNLTPTDFGQIFAVTQLVHYADNFTAPLSFEQANIGPQVDPDAYYAPFIGWALKSNNLTIGIDVSDEPNGPLPEANLGLAAMLLGQ